MIARYVGCCHACMFQGIHLEVETPGLRKTERLLYIYSARELAMHATYVNC